MKNKHRNIKIILSSLILLFAINILPQQAKAQSYDQELATQYMNAGDYDKAAVLWEQLYEKYRFRSYLNNYMKCLNALNDFKTAEKFLKKEIRKNSNDASLLVELGVVYQTNGNQSEANKQFDKAIKQSTGTKQVTTNTANYFLTHRLFDNAETLYKSAAEAQKITYDYELANLYYYQRNYEKMTLKYLDLLHENPNYLNVVENRYQYIMTSSEDENYLEYLEINLLKRIQKYSQKTVYLELITWLFIQTGRYEEAFTQLISLDKKSNTHGNLLIDFGIMLNENSEYDLALNSFDYVINLGENKPNYHYAQIQYLNTLYKKTISSSNHKQEELLKLEQMLEDHLKKSSTKNSFLLTYALANIKAFYLNKMEDASDFLNSVIQEGKLTNNELSECKLLYGDILLFIDNPWDASLIYAQVEKANTNNPFGHEAKFRKAKLAYYTGQFEWAQAQLNILKASTSQLIANDAFELSFFINENSALDTSYNALSMFARSDLLQFKHKHKEALQTLDSIIEQYSSHEIIDDVYYRKGDIYASLEEYDLAIEAYKKVANTYSYDILADNALYKLALLYDHVIKDKPKAMETYKRLLTDYPSSIFVVETRKRFRFLRGETFQEEIDIEEDFFRNIYR